MQSTTPTNNYRQGNSPLNSRTKPQGSGTLERDVPSSKHLRSFDGPPIDTTDTPHITQPLGNSNTVCNSPPHASTNRRDQGATNSRRTPAPNATHCSNERRPNVTNPTVKLSLPGFSFDGQFDDRELIITENSQSSSLLNRLGSSVKNTVSAKLGKSSSEIKSDALSVKGSQLQITQQPPTFKQIFPFLGQSKYLQNFASVEEVGKYFKALSESSVSPSTNKDIALPQNEDATFFCGVWMIFTQIQAAQHLFPLMAIDPAGWNKIITELQMRIQSLSVCKVPLEKLNPQTENGKQLCECLRKELKRQFALLQHKKISIEQVRDRDPFAWKRVVHMNGIWALVIGKLFDDAQKNYLRVSGNFDAQRPAIQSFQRRLQKELNLLELESRLPVPTAMTVQHPVKEGKENALKFLFDVLTATGLTEEEAKNYTEGKIVQDVLFAILNNQKLPPDTQRIVASLNGVTGCYEMETIFDDGWVSSAHIEAEGKPRNFKLHRLYKIEEDDQKVLMRNVVGHGVDDAWGEADAYKRANSNMEVAFKVVYKAATSDPRIIKICNEGKKPKITHVSLLLVTPTSLTQLPVEKAFNHHEKDYAKAQFAAFDIVNKQGYIRLGGNQAEIKTEVKAEIEVITFGFGINLLSTGDYNGKVTGGWSNVEAHNRKAIERLFGNCQKGQRPYGLIGEVMNEIERPHGLNIDQQAFLSKLQQKTNTILKIYKTEAYKESNGDPAKINREIESLLNTANKALAAINSTHVITLSKGCKSDKDRGGVVITEIFTNAIVEDLGGSIAYNEKLNDEVKSIYLNVATSQFQIQIANTGLPGNKAVGWAVSEDEQVFLKGLSVFAKE